MYMHIQCTYRVYVLKTVVACKIRLSLVYIASARTKLATVVRQLTVVALIVYFAMALRCTGHLPNWLRFSGG